MSLLSIYHFYHSIEINIVYKTIHDKDHVWNCSLHHTYINGCDFILCKCVCVCVCTSALMCVFVYPQVG